MYNKRLSLSHGKGLLEVKVYLSSRTGGSFLLFTYLVVNVPLPNPPHRPYLSTCLFMSTLSSIESLYSVSFCSRTSYLSSNDSSSHLLPVRTLPFVLQYLRSLSYPQTSRLVRYERVTDFVVGPGIR